MTFSIFVFIVFFLFASNYFQVVTFASLIVGPKIKTSKIVDKWILNTIKNKTGLVLKDLTIYHDQKPYGMMAGIPPFPELIISEKLYKIFNKDEMEWVILHEAGHCVLWHNPKAIVIEFLLMFGGIYFIKAIELNIFLAILLSFVLSVMSVQIIRRVIEYEADKFSISRVANPQGVITAQNKFRKYYGNSVFGSEKSIIRKLFHWNISPDLRIKMAQQRQSYLRLSL
ncbi:MAG: M48 family metalloprotease [Patescibacteria group bacterium]|jgi:Zn-dependent protease with chaperone function